MQRGLCVAYVVSLVAGGCGPSPRHGVDAGGDDDDPIDAVPEGTPCACSSDGTQVLDCGGLILEQCDPEELCADATCMPACDAASANQSSVGCDYYAIAMGAYGGAFGGCFVAFVANTWSGPVKLTAAWGTAPIDLAVHARIPTGSGPTLTYGSYDPALGLAPGEVAIIFLANDPVQHGSWTAPAACPVPAFAGLDAHVHWGLNISSGRTSAFHITADRPVVAYQMLPYNAASSASTGATLLLPSSAWDTNYVGVAAARDAFADIPIPPTMAIVAKEDGTSVTILPTRDIRAGIDVAPTTAGVPITYTMSAGQLLEFIQTDELTGSPIQSTKPVAVFAGHMGLRVPYDVPWSDHAEQQIPPVRALGHEYAVASYRDRVPGVVEHRRHRLVGAVDGTLLTFDPPVVGAPSALDLGTIREFEYDGAFVVTSQDATHPFVVSTYMSGSETLAGGGAPAGYGDSEFLRVVPGLQYLRRYVFFTDPTYPETNLVVIRRRTDSGFYDVDLDCAGTLTGWQPIGLGGTYEVTRVDLSRHDFAPQGACDNGRHEMESAAPFGLFVWGWGSPETRAGETYPCVLGEPDNSCDVSYAYPAGESVVPINDVVIPPIE